MLLKDWYLVIFKIKKGRNILPNVKERNLGRTWQHERKNAAELALSERALGNRPYIIIFDSQWQKEIWEMKMKVFIDMQVYLLKYKNGLYPKIHKLFERE